MKEFFARLNPTERRFVVGVAVVFFLVINIVWVWPHFGDWSDTKKRMDEASKKLVLFEGGTNLIPGLQKEIAKYQSQGEIVPGPDQAVRFVRLIQSQTAQFGFVPESMNPVRQSAATNNQYFVEQGENLTLQTSEKQLVDFLYSLGAGANSLIRVKVLSVTPDPSHQRLTSRITLVASYQKKAVGSAPASARSPAPEQKPAANPAAAPPVAKPTAAPSAAKPTSPISAMATNRSPGLRPFGATNRPPPGLPGQTGVVKTLTPPKK